MTKTQSVHVTHCDEGSYREIKLGTVQSNVFYLVYVGQLGLTTGQPTISVYVSTFMRGTLTANFWKLTHIC